MNGIKCTVKALDGKLYETSVDDWFEQTLSNNMRVWTKLLNIGNGKMVAISHEEAVKWGIDVLYVKGEKIDRTPKQADFDKSLPVIKEDVNNRLAIKAQAMSPTSVKRPTPSRPTPTSDTPPAPQKPAAPKRPSFSTANLIEEEALNLKSK